MPSRSRLLLLALLSIAARAVGQFYSGSQQEYGKNRVQYQDFLWQQYRFQDMEVFFYKEGRDLARYTAQAAQHHLKELEKEYDFTLDERLQFIVYNSLTDFRQSNIGLEGMTGQNNIGGLTRIVGTKIFVDYEGDHTLLDQQIRSGIAQVIIDQMMFGGNWREMIRSATFLSLPNWYTEGIMSYHSRPWDATLGNRVRDGVMSGRFDKFNRLEGEDARDAGHMSVSLVGSRPPFHFRRLVHGARHSRSRPAGRVASDSLPSPRRHADRPGLDSPEARTDGHARAGTGGQDRLAAVPRSGLSAPVSD